MNLVLQLISAVSAGAAAWFWLKSSLISLPRIEVIDGGEAGDGYANNPFLELTSGLILQGQLSSRGAYSAAISAGSQALVILLPLAASYF